LLEEKESESSAFDYLPLGIRMRTIMQPDNPKLGATDRAKTSAPV
jgi:hypothetical protein